jgi:hypothetical protein
MDNMPSNIISYTGTTNRFTSLFAPFLFCPTFYNKNIVGAVFKGWMNDRAIKYREVENIHGLLGTAVNIQAMVFGNMGDSSGTGVCFSRSPNDGTNELFGEFLMNAQVRTTQTSTMK